MKSVKRRRPRTDPWGRRREIKETFKFVAQKIMINRIKYLGEIKKHQYHKKARFKYP
jgi:hypothetical protein